MTKTKLTLPERHGLLVADRRNHEEISQRTLAELADTSQQTISRIEAGTCGTSDDMRVRIADALGVKAAELFPYEDED